MPPDGLKLGLVIGELKSRMAKEFFADSGHQSREPRVYWQRRCYDHNCRSPETVREKINYCHTNPVKRGLVSEPDECDGPVIRGIAEIAKFRLRWMPMNCKPVWLRDFPTAELWEPVKARLFGR